MIIITRDKIVVYVLEDSEYVEIREDLTVIGNPPIIYVSDCKSNNAEVVQNVNAPSDWFGGRYIYENSEFKLNPNFIEEILPTQSINQPTTGLDEI